MKRPYDICECTHPRVEHGGAGCLGYEVVEGALADYTELCMCPRFVLWLGQVQ